MFILILSTIVLAALSALFYRIGGMSSKEAKEKLPWLPFRPKKWIRRFFCPLMTVIWLLIIYPSVPWYIYIATIGITFGLGSGYWDDIFGYDNFYAHGAAYALGAMAFPIYLGITTGAWNLLIGFGIRVVVLGLFMGIWCKIFGDVDMEEYGRGGSIVVSLPLMLIK